MVYGNNFVLENLIEIVVKWQISKILTWIQEKG